MKRADNFCQSVLDFMKIDKHALSVELFPGEADRDVPVMAMQGFGYARDAHGVGRGKDSFDRQFIHGGNDTGQWPAKRYSDQQSVSVLSTRREARYRTSRHLGGGFAMSAAGVCMSHCGDGFQ